MDVKSLSPRPSTPSELNCMENPEPISPFKAYITTPFPSSSDTPSPLPNIPLPEVSYMLNSRQSASKLNLYVNSWLSSEEL